MRVFKYIGKCAAGFVEFKLEDGSSVRMAEGEPVEVPDFLAAKFEKNRNFEEAKAEKYEKQSDGGGKKGKGK